MHVYVYAFLVTARRLNLVTPTQVSHVSQYWIFLPLPTLVTLGATQATATMDVNYSATGAVYGAEARRIHGGTPVVQSGRYPGQCCFGCNEYEDMFTGTVMRLNGVEPEPGQLAHCGPGGCLCPLVNSPPGTPEPPE